MPILSPRSRISSHASSPVLPSLGVAVVEEGYRSLTDSKKRPELLIQTELNGSSIILSMFSAYFANLELSSARTMEPCTLIPETLTCSPAAACSPC